MAKVRRYRPGDLVRIRSVAEIKETLDAASKLEGCLFMGGMSAYCGSVRPVHRCVEWLFDEHRCKMLRAAAPLYLLRDTYCEGTACANGIRCDRTCYCLWHEDWIDDAC